MRLLREFGNNAEHWPQNSLRSQKQFSCATGWAVLLIDNAVINGGWGMGDIRVRNLEDEVVAELKARARRHGNSLEAELRSLLTAEARRPRQELAKRLADFRDGLREKYGELPDSTPFIRAERDEWG